MNIRYRRMLSDIEGDIIIYGLGNYAKTVYEKFIELGICDRIKCFVISDLKGEKEYFGKKVYGITNLKNIYEAETILVAVSELYIKEIADSLNQYQISKIIYLTDYIEINKDLNITDIIYKNDNSDFFLSLMCKWSYENYGKLFQDKNSMHIYLKERKLKIETRQIVFIVGLENAMPRTVRIMAALKRKGYEIILMTYGNADGSCVAEELDRNQIKIIPCDSLGELMYKMLFYNPLVYYIEPIWGDCKWMDVIINLKHIFGKIVITLYDVFNDGMTFATEEQKLLERHALENADGIIWRWFSEEDLAKEMNLVPKSIHFLDCCDNYEDVQEEIEEENNVSDLKLSYVIGDISLLFEIKSENNRFTRYANVEEIVSKIIKENPKCHLHFFVLSITEENKEKCIKLENQYSNLKFFFKVEHTKLVNKLKKYDYGVLLFTGGEEVPEEVSAYGMTGRCMNNAVTNKYFDFLEAGIPFLSNGINKKLIEMFSKYNTVVKMDLSNFDLDYLCRNKKIYKKNALRARKDLMIDNQIGKLIDFFESFEKEKKSI